MYNFDTILNIIMTAILGYFALNTIFRFHFSFDRIYFMFVLVFLITVIWYQDTDKVFEFILTVGIEVLVFGITKLITHKKKNFGYFLFNVYRKQYESLHKDLFVQAEELEIRKQNICHYRNKPFLLVFRGEEHKKVAALVKKIDHIQIHAKKTFTMYNYWVLVAFIVLEVIIWRF